MIRPATVHDAKDICDIYNYYVENTVISFEEEAISLYEMEQRIATQIIDFPWFVYEENGKVIAYAYACQWKERSAYRFTLESTIYMTNRCQGKGVGTKLYQTLFDELESSSVRSVISVIALPNKASIGLHEKMGFEKVAHFKKVGFKRDKWIDVGFWQKMID